jgi:thiosulfate/3-mercaptopyruvate sulfurtransferase
MTVTTSQVLTSTEEVAARLRDADLRVLEVDEDTEAYGRGHLPGALAVHWRRDLQDPVRRQFTGPDELGALMDGGRRKWELEGRPLSTDTPRVEPTSGYRVQDQVEQIRALRGQVEGLLGEPGVGLVDVRSPEEYRGELLAPYLPQEQAQRPGHVPGARNVPWAEAVDPETGAFLPTERLRSLYEGQGPTPDLEVVVAYCRIGERSAHSWFVLHELLGYPRVRNDDGSWTEWGSMVGVPIER